MDEQLFRAVSTAVLKTAQEIDGHRMASKERLSELDIDVIVSEAIKVAGKRIEDCPGPLGGFWEAVGYAGDVVFEDKTPDQINAEHVIEVMWGMPNWLCIRHCWDCMREDGELGNRNSTYLFRQDRQRMYIRMDGLYAVAYKHNGARGWSDKSEQHAKFNALRDLMKRAGT